MPAMEAEGVVVMDGSMGRLTMLKGVPVDDNLWAARGLVEERYHEIVIQAHASYIEAGARLLTTNSYAVQPNYYRRVFDDWEARIPGDCATAARLAVEARRRACGPSGGGVRILGCLPPLCESHRPDLMAAFVKEHGEEFCVRTYRTIAEALIRGGPVDGFIAETMNNWAEARLAIEAVRDLGLPLVVSLEGALRGADLTPRVQSAPELAALVLEAKAGGAPIEALGFNCAPPEDLLAALEAVESSGMGARLRGAGVKLAAYANVNDRRAAHNGGFDARKFKGEAEKIEVREDLKGSGYLPWCKKFMKAGASYCGGCCGSTPEVIKELSESIAKALKEEEEGGGKGEKGPEAPEAKRLKLAAEEKAGA